MAKPSLVLPLLGLAFLVWIVFVAGIAALQSQCSDGDTNTNSAGTTGDTAYLAGVNGFSPGVLGCSKVYRWSWFIVAFEFVVIVGTLIATVMGRLWHGRLAFIALFAVATLLYMLQSETYLTLTSVGPYNSGVWLNRARVAAAGAIMVTVLDIFLILALGIDTAILAATTTTGAYQKNEPVVGNQMGPGYNAGDANMVPATAV